ncbi:MAG: DNA translocase FtsK [Ardenticatenales bacterium]
MTVSPLAHPAASLASALAEAGVRAHQIDARRGPRLASFDISLGGADIDRVLRMGRQIAHALQVRSVRVAESKAGVAVEAPLPAHLWLPLTARQCIPGQPVPLEVGIGRDARGSLVRFRFGGTTPHMGVWGGSQCGKSEAVRNIVYQLAMTHGPAELPMVLIDGKNRGLVPFARLPHLLAPLATTPEDGARLIAGLVRELDVRRDDPSRVREGAILLVVVDEAAEFTGAAGDGLCRVASMGAELGIRLLVSSQHPTTGAVQRLVTANLGARLVGKCNDDPAARLCMGGRSEAPRSLEGKGDFLLVTGDEDQARRVQVGMVTDDEYAMLPVGHPGPIPAPHPAPHPEAADVARVAAMWDGGGMPGIMRIRRDLGCGDSRARRLRDEAAAMVGDPGIPARQEEVLTHAHAGATTGREG